MHPTFSPYARRINIPGSSLKQEASHGFTPSHSNSNSNLNSNQNSNSVLPRLVREESSYGAASGLTSASAVVGSFAAAAGRGAGAGAGAAAGGGAAVGVGAGAHVGVGVGAAVGAGEVQAQAWLAGGHSHGGVGVGNSVESHTFYSRDMAGATIVDRTYHATRNAAGPAITLQVRGRQQAQMYT